MVATAEPVTALADPPPGREAWRRPLLTTLALAGVLALLTALVVTGAVVHRIDLAILHAADPNRWGRLQRFCDHLVEDFRPAHVMLAFAVAASAIAIRRRSVFPLLFAGVCQGAASLAVVALKTAVAARDPHQGLINGGSFPSGHTAELMLAFGTVALLTSGRAAKAMWTLTALATTGMGAALIIEGAHWASDVIGGALLAGIILTLARAACIHPGPMRSLIAGRTRKPRGQIE